MSEGDEQERAVNMVLGIVLLGLVVALACFAGPYFYAR
jgi:hypothetical protein